MLSKTAAEFIMKKAEKGGDVAIAVGVVDQELDMPTKPRLPDKTSPVAKAGDDRPVAAVSTQVAFLALKNT